MKRVTATPRHQPQFGLKQTDAAAADNDDDDDDDVSEMQS